MTAILPERPRITTWPQFERRVRLGGFKLLERLDDFPDTILVTGCQRSGTTMLARIIAESDGIHNFSFGTDACLDAGLILSGYIEHEPAGRYCFQTTHVDERYMEYLDHRGDFRMIWCLRNPLSVVYSLVYNWTNWGLNTTFRRCGASRLAQDETSGWAYRIFGPYSVARLRRGCMIYNTKLSQLFTLRERLADRLLIVDYDQLVKNKEETLPRIYAYLNLEYRDAYAKKINSDSLDKSTRLTAKEVSEIRNLCQSSYEMAGRLMT